MPELTAKCPAADLLRCADGEAVVICGVMRRRFDLLDSILGGITRGVVMTESTDPNCIRHLCCGTDLPVLGPDQVEREVGEFGTTKSSYTCCPVWMKDRELDWAFQARHDLIEAGNYVPADDAVVPTLADLIYGRASIEEWAETYAGPPQQDWTDAEEAQWTGERPSLTREELAA